MEVYFHPFFDIGSAFGILFVAPLSVCGFSQMMRKRGHPAIYIWIDLVGVILCFFMRY
jgi:hypothetical protein